MKSNLALKIKYKLLIAISSLLIIACQSSGLSGSSILYISEKDGNPEIYSMDKNGNNHMRLTNSSKEESIPKLSPDGNRISFLSTKNSIKELRMMDFEGNQEKLLSRKGESVEDFFWSPDSTKIAYKWKNSDGQHDINVYSINDETINEVTNNTAIEKLGN